MKVVYFHFGSVKQVFLLAVKENGKKHTLTLREGREREKKEKEERREEEYRKRVQTERRRTQGTERE